MDVLLVRVVRPRGRPAAERPRRTRSAATASSCAPAVGAVLVGPAWDRRSACWRPELGGVLAGRRRREGLSSTASPPAASVVAWRGRPVARALGQPTRCVAYTRTRPLSAWRERARRLILHDPGAARDRPRVSLAGSGVAPAVGSAPAAAPRRLACAVLHTRASTTRRRTARAPLPPGFLAIHPGSGSTAKNWPAERFLRGRAAGSAGEPTPGFSRRTRGGRTRRPARRDSRARVAAARARRGAGAGGPLPGQRLRREPPRRRRRARRRSPSSARPIRRSGRPWARASLTLRAPGAALADARRRRQWWAPGRELQVRGERTSIRLMSR